MSYIQANLRKGEKIVFETKLNILPVVLSALWSWMLLFIPTLLLIMRYLHTEFAVTNKRLVIKHGTFSSNTTEMPLDKVNNTSYSQGILGKMFNYGTVSFVTSGATMPFKFVANPKELRDVVGSAADAYQEARVREQAEAIARSIKAPAEA